MYKRNEIFPKEVSPRIEKLTNYPKFGALLGEKTVRHFCLYMEEDVIKFQKRMLTQVVMNTFPIHGREAKTFNQFRPNDINWQRVLNKFGRVAVESNRKNADTRTGFKIGSDYLVKANFTFGLRQVNPGTAHIIQTLNVPLLFYLKTAKSFSKLPEKRKFEKGLFTLDMINKYDRRILEPHTCYRIPPGTIYLIFSTQKNFFRLDLVDENYQIPFQFTDPVKVRVAKMEGMYDEPVQTPFIEDDEEENHVAPTAENSNANCSSFFEFVAPDCVNPAPAPAATTTYLLIPTNPPVLETPANPPVLETTTNPPVLEKTTNSPVLERPTNLSILKRNVLVAPVEFLTGYRRLIAKEYKNPLADKFTPDDSFNPEPLDLTFNGKVPDPPMVDLTEEQMDIEIPEATIPPIPEECINQIQDEDLSELDRLIAAASAADGENTNVDMDLQRQLDELCNQFF